MTRHLDPDLLEMPAGTEAREHLRMCAECRSRLASVDPSRIFMLLADAPLPAKVLDDVSAAVSSALPESRRQRPMRARRGVAGVLAAGLALAALLAGPLTRPLTRPPVADETFPVSEARAGVEVHGTTESAQVFDLMVGDTQVTMIFDEGLEL